MKKIILIILFYAAAEKTQSQNYVYIPDPAFRAWLNTHVPAAMSGNYMDTQSIDVANTSTIEVSNMGIYDLTGVQYFHQVWAIVCDYNFLSSLPPLPPNLQFLYCPHNNLYSLPALPNSVNDLRCFDNFLTSLPSLPTALEVLWCGSNNLTTLPALPANLGLLECSDNQITCLPTLPAGLHELYDVNAGYSCLPNIPSSLAFNTGPSSICSQNQAAITAGGATNFCSGGSVTLNANTGAGLTYQWQRNGATILGAIFSGYAATTTGSYTVVETSQTGCTGEASAAVVVTVNSLPSATITPAGPTIFCSGGSAVLNAPTGANKTYQWKKGANLISGATLSSYTAITGGNYRVIVTNTVTGCSKTTGSATVVTVNPLPAATITPQGPTTFCAGGSVVLAANTGAGLTYKWKKGSNFISGATLSNYTATTGGNYKVQVTNSNGCSKTSGTIAVSVPCKEGEIITSENIYPDSYREAIGIDFSVYPNPNSGEFTIKFSTKPTSPIQIEMTDETGKVVKRFEAKDETVVIKESNLMKGIYYLTMKKNEVLTIKKIIIRN